MAVQAPASHGRPGVGAGGEGVAARRIALLRHSLQEGRPLLVVEGGGADDRGPLLDALRSATPDGLYPVLVSGRAASREELADRILEVLGAREPRDEPSPSAVQRRAERLLEQRRRLLAIVDEGGALDLETLRWLIGLTRGPRSCTQLVLAWDENPRFGAALSSADPCPELPDLSFAPPEPVAPVPSAPSVELPLRAEAALVPVEASEPMAPVPEAPAVQPTAPASPLPARPVPRIRTKRDRVARPHASSPAPPPAQAVRWSPSAAPPRHPNLRAASWLAGSLAMFGALACLAVYAASIGWVVSLSRSQTSSPPPPLHATSRDVPPPEEAAPRAAQRAGAPGLKASPPETLGPDRSQKLREPNVAPSGRPFARPDLRQSLEALAATDSSEVFDATVSLLRQRGPDAAAYEILDALERRMPRSPQEAVEIFSTRTRVRAALCAAWSDDAQNDAAARLGCPGTEAIRPWTARR